MPMHRVDLGEILARLRDGPPRHPKGSDSLVGIWTPAAPSPAKLVSIGMRIRGGITSHGFALNIDPDLTVYDRFTACRLDGAEMTSLRRLADTTGRPLPPEPIIRDALAASLGAIPVRA